MGPDEVFPILVSSGSFHLRQVEAIPESVVGTSVRK